MINFLIKFGDFDLVWTSHFNHFFLKCLNDWVFSFNLWWFIWTVHINFHGQVLWFLYLLFTLMKSFLKVIILLKKRFILFAKLIYLLSENVILILKNTQLLIRLDWFIFVLRLWNSFIHCILNNNNKSLLTSFIQTHDFLNVILLLRSLHKHGNDCLEKFYCLFLRIIFCNLYQFHIIYF